MNIDNSKFVHLHCHGEYSHFDGLARISDVDIKTEDNNLVLVARKMGFPAMAITDHGNIGGWIKFIAACTATKDKNGDPIPYAPIKPILGMESYLSRNRHWKSKDSAEENGGYQKDGRKGNRHLNLYAMNWDGYQNLCTLSQTAWTEGLYFKDPRIDLELLAKNSKGIMGSSACLGSIINANLLYDRYEEAKTAAGLLKEILDGNFFLEIQYHGMPEEKHIAKDILKLSRELDLPVCATQDSHYIYKHQAKAQEVLMCMSTSNCLTNPKHIRLPYDEFYFKSAAEMEQIFHHIPQVLTNTYTISERIDSAEIQRNLFGGMRLPKFELPQGFDTPMKYLVHLAKEGLKKLGWDKSQKHIDALKMELRDIQVAKDMNGYDFATYFLIVWDYVNFARSKGIITGAGRGSGYASVLLRCLGVYYGPDPLLYGLIWERFLGFDSKKFVMDMDFGFITKSKSVEIPIEIVSSGDDEDRDVVADPGGVDRY